MADEKTDNPFDPAEWLKNLSVPGVDMNTILERGRKDMEALQEANRLAVEGWQTIAQKQAEMLRESYEQWQKNMSESVSRTPQENMEHQAEAVREGFEQAMANMREMAEVATKAQTEAMEVMRKRFEENMRALTSGSDSGES